MIYEIESKEKTTYKAVGHIDLLEFKKALLSEYGINANLGDIKHGYEKERIKRYGKKYVVTHQKCFANDWGAQPITYCTVKK